MADSVGRDSDKFMLRLPDGMRDRIKAAADSNNRSMNAEIVATLEHAYPAPIYMPPDMQTLTDYMAFVESAETDKEREEFVRLANEGLSRDVSTSAWQICIGRESDGNPALYLTMRKT